MTTPDGGPRRAGSALPVVLLGIGLGGFFDGIVLHQILQWHHMLSAYTPPDTLTNLELNTTADGAFHAATWVLTVAGVFMLTAATLNGGAFQMPRLIGGLLAGWGGFNLVEGLVSHQILGLHHVRPGPDELLYDIGFLIWGAIMLAIGIVLLRRQKDRYASRR